MSEVSLYLMRVASRVDHPLEVEGQNVVFISKSKK